MPGPWGYLEVGKAHHQALLEEAERGLKPWNGELARLLEAAAEGLLRLERKGVVHARQFLGNMRGEG